MKRDKKREIKLADSIMLILYFPEMQFPDPKYQSGVLTIYLSAIPVSII